MNMHSKYYFLAVCLVICITSCEYLNTKVDTGITQENLDSDYSRLQQLGYAPYTYLRHGFNVLDQNIIAAITDEAEQTSPSSQAQLYNNGSWSRYTNPLDVYSNNYRGIRSAYFFLDYSTDYKNQLAHNRDTITSGSVNYWNDVENIEWMRAEANILIGWYYFDLIKRYGGVPLVEKVLNIDDETNIPRASFDEIVEFIVSKIDNNKDKLQRNWKGGEGAIGRDVSRDGRITLGAALALKSRVLLYAASPLYNVSNNITKWEDAAKAANDVIKLKKWTYPSNIVSPVPPTITNLPAYKLSNNYRNLFLEANSVLDDEVIWAYRLGATNQMEVLNYPIGTPGGQSGVTPSHNLVSAYEYTDDPDPENPYANRDPRLGYSIVTNNSAWNGRTIETWQGGLDSWDKANTSRTGYYLKKFLIEDLDIAHGATRNRNWIFFRYAEILLNYAEAMNEAYGPDSDPLQYGMTAREAINMVRSRPSVEMPPVNVPLGDQNGMREKIKHERRIELAFEDHRYWDLRRWKDGTELSKPLLGIRATKIDEDVFSYTEFKVEDRVFDIPKMYYFPFPDAEIRKSNGILTQNPGW